MTSGDRPERKLTKTFRQCGWGSVRIPASGSGTEADLPDVIAGRSADIRDTDVFLEHGIDPPLSDVLAIEIRSSSESRIYVDEDRVTALNLFCHDFGAKPRVGAYFKGQGSRSPFYLVHPSDCYRTPAGNYGVKEHEAERRASMIAYPETGKLDAFIDINPPTDVE